ncbi:RNA polymerase sigma factor [Sorangium sp. So ce1335]|uniref:RNA polymerase sigma factor n=1 Tax=Sorangium sp. So ce1335 TaxID=3133335 RepID=UPI003F629476
MLGVDETDIDDLCQEVLIAAYESLDRFDPAYPDSPPPLEAASPPPLEAAAPPPIEAASPPPIEAASLPPIEAAYASLPQQEGRPTKGGNAEARWVFGIAWRKVSHYLDRAYRRREVPNGLHPAPYGQPVDPVPSSEQRIAERERLAIAIEVLGTIAPERRIVLALHEAYEVPIVEIARALAINYNTACSRLRLAREDYRAAVQRLRPEQRQALRACWLPLPLASSFLALADGAGTAAPPVPSPPSPAPPGGAAPPGPPAPPPAPPGAPAPPGPPPPSPATSALRRRLALVGLSLGSAAAGGAGTVAVLLALAPQPVPWARRFGALLPETPPARSALAAAIPPHAAAEPPHPAEPRPAPTAAEALPRPCATTPRTAPSAVAREGAEETFEEERRLLAAAHETLAAGDPAGALRQLAAHEARFPAGRMKSVREQLRTVTRTRLAQAAQSPAGTEPSR